jgi:hypothetical protein
MPIAFRVLHMLRLARVVLPPLVALALMLAGFAWAARDSELPVFAYDTWIKWDSGHYLTIAERGYEFMSCAELEGYNPAHWCGNSGWFPGYPYLLRGLRYLTGAPTMLLEVLVSQAFAFVDLLLVWNLFLGRRQAALLLLAAFAPGTYYFLVGFPMSMAVCFMLLALWAQRERHHFGALLAGVAAGLTYPSGIWLAGVMGGALLVGRRHGQPASPGAWFAAAGPIIGFGVVLLIHHLSVGQWNAFFLTQEKYGHTVNNPLAVLWQRSLYIWVWRPGWQIGLQSLLAASIVISAVMVITAAIRRRADAPGEPALALLGLMFWLIPLVIGGGVSPYRAESLLMPAVAALRRVRWFVLVPLILWAIAIWLVMATQFVQGWLV